MTFSPEATFDLLIMVLVGGGITVVIFSVIYFIALRVVLDESQDVEVLVDTQPDALRAARRELPSDPDEWEVPRPSSDADCGGGNGVGTA